MNTCTDSACACCHLKIHPGQPREECQSAPFHKSCLDALRAEANEERAPIELTYWKDRLQIPVIVMPSLEPYLPFLRE